MPPFACKKWETSFCKRIFGNGTSYFFLNLVPGSFCMLLSFCPSPRKRGRGLNPQGLVEEVSWQAACPENGFDSTRGGGGWDLASLLFSYFLRGKIWPSLLRLCPTDLLSVHCRSHSLAVFWKHARETLACYEKENPKEGKLAGLLICLRKERIPFSWPSKRTQPNGIQRRTGCIAGRMVKLGVGGGVSAVSANSCLNHTQSATEKRKETPEDQSRYNWTRNPAASLSVGLVFEQNENLMPYTPRVGGL